MRNIKYKIGKNNVDFYGYLHDDLSGPYGVYKLRPAVIVIPGGGYSIHSLRSEDPVIMPLLAAGYQVFILKNSLEDQIRTSAPEEELALSIALLKNRAAELDIDKDKIAVLGMSAGGHLAASVACHWKRYGEKSKPDCAVLCYPVITMGKYTHQISADNITQKDSSLLEYYSLETQVSDDTVPCFIWHTAEDELVDVRNSLLFYTALLDNHIPSELHIFQKGLHGLVCGHSETGMEIKSIQFWFPMAVEWLNERWNFVL